jgi:predicted CXXCH cytochrome family protein
MADERKLNDQHSMSVARCLLVLIAAFCSLIARADTLVNSVHNLSVSGPGIVKATSESDVCIFCHTAHHSNGATPLWNHNLSGITNYIVYSSSTLDALGVTIPQPNGSSRLCLSCHDGTIALGSVNSRTSPISMQNGVTTMPVGANNLGTDLSGDHPISFVYDSALAAKDPQIKDPATLTGKVKLDHAGRMQCTACHNPHDNQFGNFLVMDNTGSALCVTCHNVADWSASAHSLSSQSVTPTPQAASRRSQSANSKATSIAAQGCANCHTPHFAGARERLLKFAAPEQNCLPCHNGSLPTVKNVAADFQKVSIHPVTQHNEAHTPTEDVINPSTRHVTCSDCHNPHSSKIAAKGSIKIANASLEIPGVNASGAVMKIANEEYELCLRCHGDSVARGPAQVNRQVAETNKRIQFRVTNQSFHPIESMGKNRNVPSLIAPWTTSSTMTCTDCHNSDQSPSAGGSGANGPHGSIYPPLLERQLILTDFSPENSANYALCYKCHSRDSILSDQSFRAVDSQGQSRGHRFHVVDAKAACTTCHDSHGVVNSQNLINFNSDYVTPSAGPSGGPMYTSTGNFGGTCTLKCHGHDHVDSPYSQMKISNPQSTGRKKR